MTGRQRTLLPRPAGATKHASIDTNFVAPATRCSSVRASYAAGASDPVSSCPDDRVTKHEMNVSPCCHVDSSGA